MLDKIFPKPYLKLFVLLFITFLLFLFIFSLASYKQKEKLSINELKDNLRSYNSRIESDLAFDKDREWDTSRYINDVNLPNDVPYYIITSEGFIIDRNKPIIGFLDKANLDYCFSFLSPTTVITEINESWRVLCKKIIKENKVLGGIMVGYLDPDEKLIKEIDIEIDQSVQNVLSKMEIQGDKLNAEKVDGRNIELAFEIIDRFNNVVKGEGGIPSVIDKSYLVEVFNNGYFEVKDKKTQEKFLVLSSPIIVSGEKVAIVISAVTMKNLDSSLKNLIAYNFKIALIIALLCMLLFFYLYRKTVNEFLNNLKNSLLLTKSKELYFDEKNCKIVFRGKSLLVPYSTIQYEICKLLFSNTKKRWFEDELLEKLPKDTFENEKKTYSYANESDCREVHRKIYDAIRLINNKSNNIFKFKLVLLQERTYQINSNFPIFE
jgi:hypothetical protein